MKFSELITKLHSASQPHMLMYIDIRSDCELADVNILASGQSDVQAGTLYFADAGQLTPDTVLPTNLLYYGTLPPELADRLTNSAMIDRGEFAVLFQTVKELLSYQQSDQQLYTQVLYMLCNGAELDRVLTKMTDVTGDLFVVIDSTGKLVAKTKNFYVDYPLWMRSIEQGYCSDILMEYIEDRRRKNEYSLSDKPFTLFCEHMQRYLLCTRIVYDNFMMGYVIIVSKTGMFSAAEQQIIPLLSSSAKERIVKSNNGNWIDYRASQLNNIFADMLAGAQNVDMERRMKLAKLSFPEQKCLAIIRPVYYKEPAYYKSRLIPDMQAIFGKTAFSVVKNDLVLLLTAADGGTITPEQRAALEQYTQGHRLIVGISNCFQANNQLSLHYNMLLQTLQLAKQMRSDHMLKHLNLDFPITVVGYTLNTMVACQNRSNISLICGGGFYHRNTELFDSPEGVALISRLNINKCFMAAAGVTSKGNLSCIEPYEFMYKKAAINSSSTRILLVDSSKFGKMRPCMFSNLSDFDMVITDSDIGGNWISLFEQSNLKYIIV